MIPFRPCPAIPPGVVEKLVEVIAPMTTFRGAVLGEMLIPGDRVPTPSLVIECSDLNYRADAQAIADAMRPFFQGAGVFNVAPTPSGHWWVNLEKMGVVIRASGDSAN